MALVFLAFSNCLEESWHFSSDLQKFKCWSLEPPCSLLESSMFQYNEWSVRSQELLPFCLLLCPFFPIFTYISLSAYIFNLNENNDFVAFSWSCYSSQDIFLPAKDLSFELVGLPCYIIQRGNLNPLKKIQCFVTTELLPSGKRHHCFLWMTLCFPKLVIPYICILCYSHRE